MIVLAEQLDTNYIGDRLIDWIIVRYRRCRTTETVDIPVAREGGSREDMEDQDMALTPLFTRTTVPCDRPPTVHPHDAGHT